jgi:glucose/arabinose dehydrogenase
MKSLRFFMLCVVAGVITAAAVLPGARRAAIAQGSRAPNDASFTYSFPVLVEGLDDPIFLTHAKDDRLFVAERRGVIRIIKDGALLPAPFLDINDLVNSENYVEEGLLGLAFEPNYSTTKRFYVYYTNGAGNQVIARYTADGDTANESSAQVVMTIAHPGNQNHNGGWIGFGPDNYLYVGVGDGGGGGDPFCAGEDPSDLRGKILRINVIGQNTYQSPADNLFGVTQVTQRPEVWAVGLRNPWRMSFDRETGDIWIGDVGQNLYEEVSYLAAGAAAGSNFGWSRFEGKQAFSSGCANQSGKTAIQPVFDYGHNGSGGSSVTGGYVYRGSQFPGLRGFYFFGDIGSQRLWATYRNASNAFQTVVISNNSGTAPSSFGEDVNGELYIVNFNQGKIHRLTVNDTLQVPLTNKLFVPLIRKR